MSYGVLEATRILGVEREQIKTYAYRFADYLSATANPGKGKARCFSFDDMLVLIYVNYYWEDDPDIASIEAGLNAREHHDEVYIHELWDHTPLLQEEIPDHFDEPARHGLLVSPDIHLEPLEIARSYRNAANVLWQNAADSGLPMLEAYPVLHAYRHALELYLKMLGKTGEELGHNLEKCIHAVEQLYADRLPGQQLPERLRDWILTLHQLDEKGTSFRYAPKTAPTMDGQWLDWAHLRYAMGQIFEALEYAWLKLEQ